MLDVYFSGKFRRDYKRIQKQGKDVNRLLKIVDILAAEQPLAPKYRDHVMTGDFIGHRECHMGYEMFRAPEKEPETTPEKEPDKLSEVEKIRLENESLKEDIRFKRIRNWALMAGFLALIATAVMWPEKVLDVLEWIRGLFGME